MRSNNYVDNFLTEMVDSYQDQSRAWHTPAIPVLGRLREVVFQASLDYTVRPSQGRKEEKKKRGRLIEFDTKTFKLMEGRGEGAQKQIHIYRRLLHN
jgi:hypothetical protein